MLQHRPPIRVSWTPTARPLQRGPLSPARRGGGVVNTADPVTLTACKSSIEVFFGQLFPSSEMIFTIWTQFHLIVMTFIFSNYISVMLNRILTA